MKVWAFIETVDRDGEKTGARLDSALPAADALAPGDEITASFHLLSESLLLKTQPESALEFTHLGEARYKFVGEFIRFAGLKEVADCGEIKINLGGKWPRLPHSFSEGQRLQGKGRLVLRTGNGTASGEAAFEYLCRVLAVGDTVELEVLCEADGAPALAKQSSDPVMDRVTGLVLNWWMNSDSGV